MCYVNEEAKPKTPKSPWRRLIRQPLRPRLSRSIVPGARINLNRYWSKFEEVTARPLVLIGVNDNAINDNLANERREVGMI